ncbi:MAG: DUF808 domain-containing protein [Pseudomonadota bacterium]
MSTGLLALLDDVAAIAKVAAASLDDVAAQAIKAGTKSVGVVIDDAAVTPRYVVGFAAERELPIVMRIAAGSLRNKLLILLPAALALSFFLPAAITPLLMAGGLFLCYEGAEKVLEAVAPHKAHAHEAAIYDEPISPKALEDQRVDGAIRTDFILSAEIMALALSTIPDSTLLKQAIVLALVGVAITAGVYGVVAIIVKADDVGVAMAQSTASGTGAKLWRRFGRGLVVAMPKVLAALSIIGTAAMIWVGGGILVHGLAHYGLSAPEHWIHAVAVKIGASVPVASGAITWILEAAGAGLIGLAAGGLMIPIIARVLDPIRDRLFGGRSKHEATASAED